MVNNLLIVIDKITINLIITITFKTHFSSHSNNLVTSFLIIQILIHLGLLIIIEEETILEDFCL